MAYLHERMSDADRRLPEVEARIAELQGQTISQAEAREASADFDGLWESLIPRERARMLNLLLSAVEYDGEAGTVSVTFRPTSIAALIRYTEEAAVCQP